MARDTDDWEGARRRALSARTLGELTEAFYDMVVLDDHGSAPDLEEATLAAMAEAILKAKAWL